MNKQFWTDPRVLRRTAVGKVYGAMRVRFQTADGRWWTGDGLLVPDEVRLQDEKDKIANRAIAPDREVLPYWTVPPSIDRLAESEPDQEPVDGDAPQLETLTMEVSEEVEKNLDIPDQTQIEETRQRAELQALTVSQLREVIRDMNTVRDKHGLLPVGTGIVTKAELIDLVLRTSVETEAATKAEAAP